MAVDGIITLGLGASPGSVTPFVLLGLTANPAAAGAEVAWTQAPIGSGFGLRRPSSPIGAYTVNAAASARTAIIISATDWLALSATTGALADEIVAGYSGPLSLAPLAGSLGAHRPAAPVGGQMAQRRPAAPIGAMLVNTSFTFRFVVLIDGTTAIEIDSATSVVSELT